MKELEIIRIAVCDDEERFRTLLMSSIKENLDKKNIKTEIVGYESGEKMMESDLRVLDFDIIFLDVDMGQEDGFETALKIRELSPDVPIIFVTGMLNTWNKGYEVGAFRYIIKDANTFDTLLCECLEAVIKTYFSEKPVLSVNCSEGKVDIPIKSIIYIESMGHMQYYHVLSKSGMIDYNVRDRLSKYEKNLSEYGFVRIHQSFLVNTEFIKKVYNYKAELKYIGLELPVSRDKYKEVKSAVSTARGVI